MADSPSILASRAILKAVRASLGLVNSSSESFTFSQLLALRSVLRDTLTVVNGKIQVEESDDQKVVIDISDWELTSDEDEMSDGNAPGPTEEKSDYLPIPAPSQMG